MTGRPMALEEYRELVGAEVGVSAWIVVEQSRIDAFADVTLDHQPIHVDAATARTSPFGTTIAHGFLTLSLFSAMAADALPKIAATKMGLNYGFNELRFVAPVRSERRIRGRFVLKGVDERSPGVIKSTLGVTVEIEGETKPAVVAEWLLLNYL